MKAIIDGVFYDTETMEPIGSDSDYSSDVRHYEETLYMAEGPAFVLAGKGGPGSKYAEECGLNQWCGGSAMTVLSDAEAREWCERHLDVDEYLAVAEKAGWTVRRPGEEVREATGCGRLRVNGSSSLILAVTKEAKSLGLGRGDEVEYTIRKVPPAEKEL